MLDWIKAKAYGARRSLALTAGVAGGAYILGRYVLQRLDDMKEQVVQSRAAREKCVKGTHLAVLFECSSSLRRRFTQNQEDCAFTVLTLLPTLGNSILEAMDVERLTLELQSMKKGAHQPPPPRIAPPETERDTASLTSGSVVLVRDGDTDARSASSKSEDGTAQSWVDQFHQSQESRSPGGGDDSPSLAASVLSDRSSELVRCYGAWSNTSYYRLVFPRKRCRNLTRRRRQPAPQTCTCHPRTDRHVPCLLVS